MSNDQLWMDSNGFVYSADGRTLLKGASVEGAYWIPEGVEEIEPEALIGCRIGTLHIPWTAHVHEYEQLVFSKDPVENEELMPAVYFWTKDIVLMGIGCCLPAILSRTRIIAFLMA